MHLLTAVLGLSLTGFAPAGEASSSQIVLRDYLGHCWRQELVHYPMEFGAGEVKPNRLRLQDGAGRDVPFQLSDVEIHKDGSLASASVWFIVDELPANGERTWRLSRGRKTPRFKTDLVVSQSRNGIEITTPKVGVRLVGGRKAFDPPVSAEGVPSPVQGFRLRSGQWVGRGWWETTHRCTGYETELVASGPVFASAKIRFTFENDRTYTAIYQVIAGQEVVLIEEEFDLGDPARFSLPDYDKRRRLMWEMWGGTRGRYPSFHNLHFSLYQAGLFAPSKARWGGFSCTNPEKGAEPVNYHYEYSPDYTKDRFDISINSHTEWGGDESIFYTTWDSRASTDAVSVVGIRPSKWVHPNLKLPDRPHQRIQQRTSTNDIGVWVTRKPGLYLRSPVNLGRRAYLLAALDASSDLAKDLGAFDRTGELLVKYGSKPLDKVKNWVLEWEERGKYPRILSPSAKPIGEADPKRATQAFEKFMVAAHWFGLRFWRDITLRGYGPNLGNTNHADYCIWHYHADQGQLVLYAKGAPLLMDFGSQYQPYIRQAAFHNTITYIHRETAELRPCPGKGDKDCFYSKSSIPYEHDTEPFTCLQNPVCSKGAIQDFASLSGRSCSG